MRSLLVTRNFPPLRGGMERLNSRLFEFLGSDGNATCLVGPAGCRAFASSGSNVRELAQGHLPAVIASSLYASCSAARDMKPDVVIAGSGLMAPSALFAAKSAGARAVSYLHGLDIVAPSAVYRRLWLPCIRRCDRIIVNSANTRRLAIGIGVDPERIRIIHPGTDLPQLDPEAGSRFRCAHDVDEDAPLLLSVGRLTARKGLAQFVDRALPRIVAIDPRTRLVIIGDEAPDALLRGAGAGFKDISAAAQRHGIEHAVIWLGPCSDKTLAEAYQAASVHVFPVLEMPGDVEGFGMVAIEAAAHGLPTVAFAAGGVPDAVVLGKNGTLVANGAYSEFADAVVELLHGDRRAQAIESTTFASGFGWDRFGRDILRALEPAG